MLHTISSDDREGRFIKTRKATVATLAKQGSKSVADSECNEDFAEPFASQGAGQSMSAWISRVRLEPISRRLNRFCASGPIVPEFGESGF